MKKLLFFIALLTAGTARAQAPDVPTIIPPSPDAVALGKFGTYKVTNNTGTAGTNIPLYTITSSRFSGLIPRSALEDSGEFPFVSLKLSTVKTSLRNILNTYFHSEQYFLG